MSPCSIPPDSPQPHSIARRNFSHIFAHCWFPHRMDNTCKYACVVLLALGIHSVTHTKPAGQLNEVKLKEEKSVSQRERPMPPEQNQLIMEWINQPFSVRRCYIVHILCYTCGSVCVCVIFICISIDRSELMNTQSNFPLQGLTTGNYHRRFLIAIRCRTFSPGLNDKRKYRISIRISMPKKGQT